MGGGVSTVRFLKLKIENMERFAITGHGRIVVMTKGHCLQRNGQRTED